MTADRDALIRALVKPLEWTPGVGDELVSRTPYGKYNIVKPWFTGRDLFWLRGIFNGNYPTLAAAQAAAEADYRARIAAALDLDKVAALVEALDQLSLAYASLCMMTGHDFHKHEGSRFAQARAALAALGDRGVG